MGPSRGQGASFNCRQLNARQRPHVRADWVQRPVLAPVAAATTHAATCCGWLHSVSLPTRMRFPPHLREVHHHGACMDQGRGLLGASCGRRQAHGQHGRAITPQQHATNSSRAFPPTAATPARPCGRSSLARTRVTGAATLQLQRDDQCWATMGKRQCLVFWLSSRNDQCPDGSDIGHVCACSYCLRRLLLQFGQPDPLPRAPCLPTHVRSHRKERRQGQRAGALVARVWLRCWTRPHEHDVSI